MTFWTFLASGFGIGFAPRAPGTWGSLLGLFIGALCLSAGHLPLLFGIVLITGFGIASIGAQDAAAMDPGWIVIDEVAGQMVTLLALPHPSLEGMGIGFVLFRLFDILKPGPVGWADARHDAYGVMGDDLIAGVFAALVLLALQLVVRL